MIEKIKIIIDGENATMGRLASYAAKQALQGKEVLIVNSEKVIITGKMPFIKADYAIRRARGGTAQKGPDFPRRPEMILKRAIRGMLPKYGRGEEALHRIRCYNGIPEEIKPTIKAGKLKNNIYVKLGDVARLLGNMGDRR